MANPARSLGGLLSWLRVLPALGIEVSTGILPVTATCPLCQGGNFQVVDDRVLGGQWCSCRGCKFTGDLIELVARVWNVSIPAAIVRLADLDLVAERVSPESIDGYVRDHVQYRQRLNQFWERAQQQIRSPKSFPLRQLLQRFGMRDQVCGPDWPERMGRFVGSAALQGSPGGLSSRLLRPPGPRQSRQEDLRPARSGPGRISHVRRRRLGGCAGRAVL